MMGMNLASLMSSVSGLKAKPRTAILFPFSSVNFFDCLKYGGCVTELVGEGNKRFHVFRKA